MPDRPPEVQVTCRAKLNLVLEIVAKRPDGYHDLATVMHPIGLADRLRLRTAKPGIHLVVDGLPSPSGEQNLAYRAAVSFHEAIGRSPAVELTLRKRIPAASGFGGGSADAAGVLRGLNRLLGEPLEDQGLHALARGLGADVPFFLGGGAALAEGIGDRLTPLPAAEVWIVATRAEAGVDTKWAYERVMPDHLSDGTRARRAALTLLRRREVEPPRNGFMGVLQEARPDLVSLVERVASLTGCSAGLTGSGSGVYAIAPTAEGAAAASLALGAGGYWAWHGRSAASPLSVAPQAGGNSR